MTHQLEPGAGRLLSTLHVTAGGRTAPAVELREVVSPLGNWHEYRVVALAPEDPEDRQVVSAHSDLDAAARCAETLVAYLVDPSAPEPPEECWPE